MRYVIASDLHGDAAAYERLAEILRIEAPDALILLGDLLFSGFRWQVPETYDPDRSLGLLAALDLPIIAVRGNCDREGDIACLPFAIPTERTLEIDGHPVYLIHDASRLSQTLTPGTILLSGHTHHSELRHAQGILYVNPGSLAWPRGEETPRYVLVDEGRWLLKSADGEVLSIESA